MVTRAQNRTNSGPSGKSLDDMSSTDKPLRASRAEVTQSVDREAVYDNLRESDNRFTPPEFIDAVEKSFGKIDFDPCWHEASHVRPAKHFDVRRGDDGLRDDWAGGVVFVNPPWSTQDKWVKRAYGQWIKGNVTTVICLVPAATGANVFHDILPDVADIYLIRGRTRFSKEDRSWQATMRPVMVIMFGARFEQRSRFSRHVKGLWCVLERFALSDTVPVKRAGTFNSQTIFSCAAPQSGQNSRVTVLCSQFTGYSSMAT